MELLDQPDSPLFRLVGDADHAQDLLPGEDIANHLAHPA